MRMVTRHILTIPGSNGKPSRKVHYRRCGEGPVLLMVHQSPRSSAEYAELLSEWGEHFTCIAPDTPGFGQSEPLSGEPDIGDFADALAEFCEVSGIARCAAYGFHSGGVILVAAMKRRPELFSCLAVGGYAVWTPEEMRLFGESYLPEWHPAPYGEHLTWLWNRILEQSWFFPWFDVRDATRLQGAHADLAKVHRVIMEMLDAGNAYRAGYGAVLRAPRDIPGGESATPPVLITAYRNDPLHAHLARLGEMPDNWTAHGVATPQEHEEQSLAFLKASRGPLPCPDLAEDGDEGWLAMDHGLLHWRGQRGADTIALHEPAGEMVEGELAIDVPGHGLSDPARDIRKVVEDAADLLGASAIGWPAAREGDPERLYPDLTPDRFGNYLARAWSAARAEAIFRPWYDTSAQAAITVDPAVLRPEAIGARARARLRAGDAARTYHYLLQSLENQ